jgi:hypothetical protein
MRRDEWLAEFAGKLGVEPPTKDEIVALLDIAATAAHASERTAAPIACWLAGRSDLSLDELKELAGSVAPAADQRADDERG